MKILYDLQLSFFAADGRLLLEADSNYNVARCLQKGFSDIGWDCHLLMPHKLIVDPMRARFDCDIDYYEIAVKSYQPDIIWCNDPCRVSAYRSFWSGPLVTYNHWMDLPQDPKTPPQKSFYWRQFEAADKSDLLLFNSQFGIDFFVEGIKPYVPKAKLGFVNPPIDDRLWKHLSTRKTDKPSILFNHRLSSASQYARNVEHVETIFKLLDTEFGIENYLIYVSNPSQKQHALLQRNNVVNIYSDDYDQYIKRAAECWAQLSLFDYPGQWSISIAEALALGLTVFGPLQRYGYKELFDNWGIDCFLGLANDIDVVGIMHQLTALFKKPTPSFLNQQSAYFKQKLSAKNIVINQAKPLLEALI